MSYKNSDYRCEDCGAREERFVHRSEIENQVCPCGGHMKELVGAPITTFRFGDRSAIKSKKAVSLRD